MSLQQPSATRHDHWERIYREKDDHELSWHQPEPRLSLKLIDEVAGPEPRVIDIGGGSSLLAGRVLEAGAKSGFFATFADDAPFGVAGNPAA